LEPIFRGFTRSDHHSGPNAERQVQLQPGDIKRQGGHRQQGIPAAHSRLFHHCVQEIDHAGMRDLHAFWPPRRARGIDHIRQIFRPRQIFWRRTVRIVFRRKQPRFIEVVQAHSPQASQARALKERQQLRLGQQDGYLGIFQHIPQPVNRERRVQRKVSPTRLKNAQQPHHHFRRALQAQPDDRLWPHPQALKIGRQPVGLAVQRRVRHLLFAKDQRNCIRRARRLGLEQCMQAGGRTKIHIGRVPFFHNLPPLFLRQNGQPGNLLLGRKQHAPQYGLEMGHHALDGARVIQIGVVFDCNGCALTGFIEEKGQVEFRGVSGDGHILDDQPGKSREFFQVGLQREHHLEERVAAKIALHLALLHQHFQRQLGVRKSADNRFTHPPEQVQRIRVAGQVSAQHQGVDEKANQGLDFQAGAVSDGRAHAKLGLSRIAVEQDFEGGKQRHEQGDLAAGAEGFQLVQQFRRDRAGSRRPAVGLASRARAVGEQFDRLRHIREMAIPVFALDAQRLALQSRALPDGIIGVLYGQVRQGERLAPRHGVVARGKLLQEQPGRPAIRDDMVQVEEQQGVLRGSADQRSAQQRPAGKVKGTVGFRTYPRAPSPFGQVDDIQLEGSGR